MPNPDRTNIHGSSPARDADQPIEITHWEPTPEEIATEAYWIYVANGSRHGHDLEDWLEAERRLRREVPSQPARRGVTTPQQGRSHVKQEPAEI